MDGLPKSLRKVMHEAYGRLQLAPPKWGDIARGWQMQKTPLAFECLF